MNVADSQRVGSSLEHLGYTFTSTIEEADVIVLNTCVVRQSAEDKALGRLSSLKPLKEKNPDLVINLMGCLVGVRGAEKLREKLPMVDVFSPPSDPGPLISHLTQGEIRTLETDETTRRFEVMDGDLLLPVHEQGQLVSAHIPVVYGCSHACTFCIIPYKRGIERSRPVGDIVAEVRSLAAQGVKEVTLLGQIVDRYGTGHPRWPRPGRPAAHRSRGGRHPAHPLPDLAPQLLQRRTDGYRRRAAQAHAAHRSPHPGR